MFSIMTLGRTPVTVSFIASVTGSTKNPTTPTSAQGLQIGDLLVLQYGAGDNNSVTPPSITMGSNFIQIFQSPGYQTAAIDSDTAYLGYKVITSSSEINASVTATHSAPFFGWTFLIFRASNNIGPSVITSVTSFGTTGTTTAPGATTIASSLPAAPSIQFAVLNNGGGGTVTGSMAPAQTGTIGSGTSTCTLYKIQNTSPVDVVVSSTWTSGTSREAGFCCLSVN